MSSEPHEAEMHPPAEKRPPWSLLAQSIWLGAGRTVSALALESAECPTSNAQLSVIAVVRLIDRPVIL